MLGVWALQSSAAFPGSQALINLWWAISLPPYRWGNRGQGGQLTFCSLFLAPVPHVRQLHGHRASLHLSVLSCKVGWVAPIPVREADVADVSLGTPGGRLAVVVWLACVATCLQDPRGKWE